MLPVVAVITVANVAKVSEIGEDSATTLKREIKEEMGKEIEITGYVSTIENFFEMKDSKFHEIMFVHKAEFVNEEDKKIEYTIKNIEGEDYLQYEWIEIEKINEYPIVPKIIKKILHEGKFPVHKINKGEKSMSQIIEIIVDNKKYQIEWALSEHFDELKGKKFMLNKLAADQIVMMNNLSDIGKILLSAVAGAAIQHLIDNNCQIKSIFENGYLSIKD